MTSPSWPDGIPKSISRLILKLHYEGKSSSELAKQFSVSQSYVNKLCQGSRGKGTEDIRAAGKCPFKDHYKYSRSLTNDEARIIRSSQKSVRQLSKEFGVGRNTIHNIKTGKTYKDVKEKSCCIFTEKKLSTLGKHAKYCIYVSCSKDCKALNKPKTLEEFKESHDHWRNHFYSQNSGCSHGY